jgi:hypothetical protein
VIIAIFFLLIFYTVLRKVYGEKTGFIRLPENSSDFRIILITRQDNSYSTSGTASEPTEAAPGEYDFVDVRLYRTDENGDVWSTRSIIPRSIRISPGETVSLVDIREPDKAYVSTINWSPDYYNFNFIMEDKYKNQYGYLRKNGLLISSPGFVVESIDGTELFRSSFYSGCGGRLSYSGKIENLPEMFFVKPVIEKGAFKELEAVRTEGNNVYVVI